ncbi:MAG TPA: hypothetical protein VFN63_02250, partial [Pseudolabrys sp.]|nr:hypothetical protein [Pseudolabrys sp.]
AHASSFHFSVITSPPSGSHELRSARNIRSPTQTRTVDLENITSTRAPAARLVKRATIRAVTACLTA